MRSIPEYVQGSPGNSPGPGFVPVARVVLRLSWAPLPVCPLAATDDDRPERPQAPG